MEHPLDYSRYIAQRFEGDPFLPGVAEQERERLTALFLMPPWFELLFDLQSPRSAVVFGEPGSGKSALRLEVARQAASAVGSTSLVITIDDGSVLPDSGAGLDAYTSLLAERTLRVLRDHVERTSPRAFEQLQQEAPRDYDRLWQYWQQYGFAGPHRPPPPSQTNELFQGVAKNGLGPRETLRDLAALVRKFGLSRVFVLIDAIDEGLSPNQLGLLAERLRVLVTNRGLLYDCEYVFLFFLPSALRQHMSNYGIDQAHPARIFEIKHSNEQLRAILNRRLQAQSRYTPTSVRARIESFAMLCQRHGLAIEHALASESGGSPRRLLELASQIIALHSSTATRADDPIELQTVQRVIGQLSVSADEPESEQEESGEEHKPDAQPPSQLIPPLTFHSDGSVQIGGETRARLSGKLYKVMDILWQKRGKLVSYADLEQWLYDDLDKRGDPQSSREKLIRRLRSEIEQHNPKASSSHTYIDVTPGIGLVLRNTQDA